MASGEAEVYCLVCKRFTTCEVLLREGMIADRKQLEKVGLSWVRKERRCVDCGTRFWTGEFNESLIEQLASQAYSNDQNGPATSDSSIFASSETKDVNGVTKAMAEGLVRASAWWWHPSRKFVRAEGHAQNVRNSECGWLIQFGANRFLLGVAIKSSSRVLERCNEEISDGSEITGDEIIELLEHKFSSSVAKSGGGKYNSYPISYGKLQFGSQAIDVRDAAKYLMDRMGTLKRLPYSRRPYYED